MPDASDGAALKTEAAPDEHSLSVKITNSRIEAGKTGRFGGLVACSVQLVACSLLFVACSL